MEVKSGRLQPSYFCEIRFAFFILASASILFFASCKKEVDVNSPAVNIILPSGTTTLHVFDTLIVQVQVRDEQNLEWVRFQIINENNSTVLPTISRSLGDATEQLVSVGIPIDDIHLPSGEYYLKVTVFDGTNESSAFRELIIFEAPLELLKVYVVSSIAQNMVSIDSLSQGEFYNAQQIPSDFSEALVNGYDREITVVGDEGTGATFMYGETLQTLATVGSPPNDGDSFYLHAFHQEDLRRSFISRRDGFVDVYAASGILKKSISISANLRPHVSHADEEYIYIIQKNFAESQFSLAVYFLGSGQFFQSLVLDDDVSHLMSFEDGLMLFHHEEGTASFYQPDGNFVDYTIDLNLSGELVDVEPVPPFGGFLFATDQGVFYNHDIINGAPQSLAISEAKDVEYDVVSGAVYSLNDSELLITDIQGNLIEAHSVSSDARRVLLLFNK